MYKQMSSVLSNKWTIPVAVGVSSFTLGAIGGYFYGRKALKDSWVEEIQKVDRIPDNQLAFDFDAEELATVIDFKGYRPHQVIVDEHPAYQHSLIDDFEAVDDYSEFELDWDAEIAVEEDELEDAEEISNVFAGSDSEWDWDTEIMTRGEGPYIIHVDEFVANELGYEQSTFTYYEGDDIMADEKEVPVYNYDDVFGELRFGHGSKDPSLVYIRNERLKREYEVIRHTGHYSVEVRGLEIEAAYDAQELRHARSPQRFRMD